MEKVHLFFTMGIIILQFKIQKFCIFFIFHILVWASSIMPVRFAEELQF